MTYITDEQLEKATEQFASALTNKKSEEQYQTLWEQARYEGKPRYVDGVILSGHIFQKTLGDMKKMEQNTAILFGAIQSGKLDRDQLLKDFNKKTGIDFVDEKHILDTYNQIRSTRISTEKLAKTFDTLPHRKQVIMPNFASGFVDINNIKQGKYPEQIDLFKAGTMEKYQFMPPAEMRGGRVVLHLTQEELHNGANGDKRPVEVVLSQKQFVSALNFSLKKETLLLQKLQKENKEIKMPSVATAMSEAYSRRMSTIYPGSSREEHQSKYKAIQQVIEKETLNIKKEMQQPTHKKTAGIER